MKNGKKNSFLYQNIYLSISHQDYSAIGDCSEMNLDAFNEDKLFAVTSEKFNDPYDCLFRYDK